MVWLVDNDTVLGWLLNLGDNNGTLVTVGLVELSKFGKWVIANNIRVKDKEWRVVLAENGLCKLQWTSSAKRLSLEREVNLDIVGLLILYTI